MVEAETFKQLEPKSPQAKYQDATSASTPGYGPQRASCHFTFLLCFFSYHNCRTISSTIDASDRKRTNRRKGDSCLLCIPTSSWPLLGCHEHHEAAMELPSRYVAPARSVFLRIHLLRGSHHGVDHYNLGGNAVKSHSVLRVCTTHSLP